MNHVRTIIGGALCALVLAGPARVVAQEDARDRARRILAEAQAHEGEERYALAAQSYLELYDALHQAQMPRAPVALWSAGNALAQVPGHEREAAEILRRFLGESATLVADEHVRDWRSTAVGLIDELEARVPTAARDGGPAEESAEPPGEGSFSLIGPMIMGGGGALVLAGVIMGAIALAQDADQVSRCPDRMNCPDSLMADVEQTRTLAMVGDAFWIAGAVIAAAGLTLTLLLREAADGSVSLVLGGTVDGGSVRVRGAF